jgi:hypothetical protein
MLGTLTRDKDKDYISNSWLSTLKRELLGQPAFKGGEGFLNFGKELHRRFLEPQTTMDMTMDWDDQQEHKVNQMVNRLWQVPLLKEAWKRSEKEITYTKEIMGVKCLGILDMKYGRVGIDLKTTWNKSRISFYKSAVRYDYFRQAQLYIQLGDLDSFVFVAICKDDPYDVFELHCNDYPQEMEAGLRELEFLIELHKKHYNNVNT